MRNTRHVGRREFLAAAGGTLGLVAAPSSAAPTLAAAQDRAGSAGRDPAQLQRLLHEMDVRGNQYWSVPRQDAEFLQLLVKATQATRVLEVGTSHGFSAIWMGLALEETGGRLTTIEIDPARHALARTHVAEAGLSQRITLIKGDAHVDTVTVSATLDDGFCLSYRRRGA
jgi:predicted O-methyltransferase YrrM